MINAEKVNSIVLKVLKDRIESGERKALAALNTIEKCIIHAAEQGLIHTTVYPFNLYDFDYIDEGNAYLTRIEHTLQENGFHVTFDPDARSLLIQWM